jgi:hypothetical protein
MDALSSRIGVGMFQFLASEIAGLAGGRVVVARIRGTGPSPDHPPKVIISIFL